jgi:hypothetical protein
MRILAVLLVLVLASAGWLLLGRSPSPTIWHYKMTIAVETPEGLKTGSAVREVIYGGGNSRGGGVPTINLRGKGEAVVVDLGERGVLFALLRGDPMGVDYYSDILLRAFDKDGGGMDPSKVPPAGGVILSPEKEQYPMFVTFKDLNDPKTVMQVCTPMRCDEIKNLLLKTSVPYHRVETFEEAFGPGVQLTEVKIDMTNEPIT